MRAFTGARADAGRGCALSPLEPRGWPGRWSGREGPGGSGPACVAGESYAPRPAPRVPHAIPLEILSPPPLKLACTEPASPSTPLPANFPG